jgi:hypothetical protein
MHKSQKRNTRRVYRNESKQPSPNRRPGIGNDSIYTASAVSPSANHQDKTSSSFTIDRIAKPVPNAAQTLEDHQFEDPESQQQYLDCITQVWHRAEIRLSARQLENYSSGDHRSAVWQQFNILRLFFKAKMMKSLTMKTKMRKMAIHAFRTHQRPPSSQMIFLEQFLTVQLSTGRLKCASILGYVFVHVQSFPVHGGKTITSLFILIMNTRGVS